MTNEEHHQIHPAEQQKELSKKEQLLKAIHSIPEYQAVKDQWSDEDVCSYLRQIAPDSAEKTISGMLSETPAGIAVGYHERFEMSRLVEITDRYWGEGTFRKKLAEGKLEDVDYYEFEENNRQRRIFPYFIAHPEAMRAEVELLQKIAAELGFQLSKVAIFLAKPNTWEEFSQTGRTVESLYKLQRGSNLVRREADEHPDYPFQLRAELEVEVLLAEKFFREYGNESEYDIFPSEVIQRNSFLEKKIEQ